MFYFYNKIANNDFLNYLDNLKKTYINDDGYGTVRKAPTNSTSNTVVYPKKC